MRLGAVGEGLSDYTWSFPICPFKVSIGLPVVEGLQQEMAAAAEPCHGVLFGRVQAGLTHIDAWQPVAALNRESLAAVRPVGAREAVGYYSIREGSSFMLSPAEVEIANSLYSRQGAVMLLVERRQRGAPEATFYFSRGGSFVHNLPLPFPFHAGILSGEAPRGEWDIGSIPPPPVSEAPRRMFRGALASVLAICAVGLAVAYFRDGLPKLHRSPAIPTSGAQWLSTTPKQDLELSWDPRGDAVSAATAGVLRIEDGGVTRQMSLDAGDLLVGGMLYAPMSDHIRVELATLQRDGRMLKTAVSARPAAGPAAAPAIPNPSLNSPTKAPLLADALQAANDLASKRHEADRGALPRPPLKRFVLAEATPVTTAVATSPALPDTASHEALPAVAPPIVTATLPTGPLPVPPAPVDPPAAAPKAAPAPPTRPAAPRFGRFIWTGTLPRRGIVELDGRNASVGSLNGSLLPGAPVSLSITPAEFVDDGLVVYTTDAARNNRVEPPSAGNGWNKVKYVYDPERATQIAVLESPNESNGYVRLALRSDARRCSMILIDWRLTPTNTAQTTP